MAQPLERSGGNHSLYGSNPVLCSDEKKKIFSFRNSFIVYDWENKLN